MPTKHLTNLFVEKVKPLGKRVEYFDASFPGLALRVTESGHKSWVLFYRAHGRQHRYTFKSNGEPMKPDAARKAAAIVLQKVQDGIDPMMEKRAFRDQPLPTSDTFETLLRDYLEHHAKRNMKESTYSETKRSLERDVLDRGKWKNLPLAAITKRHVMHLVDGIAATGAEVHANRIHSRLRALFNWAVAKDRMTSSPMHGLKPPSGETERERVLSDDEIRWFWKACEEIGWPFGPIGRLLLLTAQRRTEVGDMDWSEINLSKCTWTIPSGRTKNGLSHEVHLSEGALRVIQQLPTPHRGRTFSATGERSVSGYSRAKDRLAEAMITLRRRELAQPEDDEAYRKALRIPKSTPLPIEIPHWTLHDLRRTATTKMAEELKIAPHVLDKVLNHSSGSIRGVAKIYNRAQYADERRSALDQWCKWIEDLTFDHSTPATSKIVNLRWRSRQKRTRSMTK
ncbi:integrase [Bradyrhizobium diazoefficiens]